MEFIKRFYWSIFTFSVINRPIISSICRTCKISGVERWSKLGGRRDHWKYVKWFALQLRFAPKAQLLKGGPGGFYRGTFWNLVPLKHDFPHSEPTLTTNFVVNTAQILRENKEPNIIYSEFQFLSYNINWTLFTLFL